jgi:hypothetical protein
MLYNFVMKTIRLICDGALHHVRDREIDSQAVSSGRLFSNRFINLLSGIRDIYMELGNIHKVGRVIVRPGYCWKILWGKLSVLNQEIKPKK